MPPRRSTRSTATREAQPPQDEAPLSTTTRRITRSSKRNASQSFPEPSQQTLIITPDEAKPNTTKRVSKAKAASTNNPAETNVEEATPAPKQPAKKTRSKAIASTEAEQTLPRGKTANAEPSGASADKGTNQRQTRYSAKIELAEEAVTVTDASPRASVTPTKRTRAMLAEDEVKRHPKLRRLESGPLSRAQNEVPKRNRRKKAASPQRLTDPFTELSAQAENVPPTLPLQEPIKRITRSNKSQNAQEASAVDRASRSKANQKMGTLESIVIEANAAEEVQEAVDQQIVQEAKISGPRGRKGKTPKKAKAESPAIEETLLPEPLKSRSRAAKGRMVQQTGTADVEVEECAILQSSNDAIPKETQLQTESMVAIKKENQATRAPRAVPSTPARRSTRNKLADKKTQPDVIRELQQPSQGGEGTVANTNVVSVDETNTNVDTEPQHKDDIKLPSIASAEAPEQSPDKHELEGRTMCLPEKDIEQYSGVSNNEISPSQQSENQNVPDSTIESANANVAVEETNVSVINDTDEPMYLESDAVSIVAASYLNTDNEEILLRPVLQSPLPAPVMLSPSQTNLSFAEPTKSPMSTSSFALSTSFTTSKETFDNHSQDEVTPTSSPAKSVVSYPSTPLASRGPTSGMERTTPIHLTEEHSPYTPKGTVKQLDVFSSPILQPPRNLVAEEERSGKSPVKNATPRSSLKVSTATSITEGVESTVYGGSLQNHDFKVLEEEEFSSQKEIGDPQSNDENDLGEEGEKGHTEAEQVTHTYGHDMAMELPSQDEIDGVENDDHNMITADLGANVESLQQALVEVGSEDDGNMIEDHTEQDPIETSDVGVEEVEQTNFMAHPINESAAFESIVVGEVEEKVVNMGEQCTGGTQDLSQQSIGVPLMLSQSHENNEDMDGSTTLILTSHPTSAESFHESDSLRGLQSYEDHGDNALLLLQEIKDDSNGPVSVDNFTERVSLREVDFSNLSTMFPFGCISGEVDVSAMIREFEKEDAEKAGKSENNQKVDTAGVKVEELGSLVPNEVPVNANAQQSMETAQDPEDDGEEMLPAFMTSPEFSNLGTPQRVTASSSYSLSPQFVAASSPEALSVFDNTLADDSCDGITWGVQPFVEPVELEKEEATQSKEQKCEQQGTDEDEIPTKLAIQSYTDFHVIDEEKRPKPDSQENEVSMVGKEQQSEGEEKGIKSGASNEEAEIFITRETEAIVLEKADIENEVIPKAKEIRDAEDIEGQGQTAKSDEADNCKNHYPTSEIEGEAVKGQIEVENGAIKLETDTITGNAEIENEVQEEEEINNAKDIDQTVKPDEADEENYHTTTSGSVDCKSSSVITENAEIENEVQEEEEINNTEDIGGLDQTVKSDEANNSEENYSTITSGSVDCKSSSVVMVEGESVGSDTPEITKKQVSFATPTKAMAQITKKPRFSLTPPLSSSTPKRSLDESPTKLGTHNEWSLSSYHINPEDIPDFDDEFSFMESPAPERQTPVSDHKATAVVGDGAQMDLFSPMRPVHTLLSQIQAGDFAFDDEFSYIEEDPEDTVSKGITAETPTKPSQSSKSPVKRLGTPSRTPKHLSSPLKGTSSPIRRSSRLSPFKKPGSLQDNGSSTPSKVPSSPGSDVSSLKKPVQLKQPIEAEIGATQENRENTVISQLQESSNQRRLPLWEVQILPRPVIINDEAVADPNVSINKRKISTIEPSSIKRARYGSSTMGEKVTEMENQEVSLDIGESYPKISSLRRQSRLSYLDSAFSNAVSEPEPQGEVYLTPEKSRFENLNPLFSACPDSVQSKRRGRRTSNTQRRQSFELEINTHLYTRLQALCRGYIYRNQLQVDQTEQKLAAEVFISAWRGLKQRRDFLTLRAAAIKIQQAYKAYRGRKQTPGPLSDINTVVPSTGAEEQTLLVSSNRFSGLFKRYEEKRAVEITASNLRAIGSEEKKAAEATASGIGSTEAERSAPISEPIVSYVSTPRRRRIARPSPVPEKYIFRRKPSTVLAKEALAAQIAAAGEDTENQIEATKPAATRIPRAGLRLPTASVLDTVSMGKRKAEDEINETLTQKPKLTPAQAATPVSRLKPPTRLILKPSSTSGPTPQLPTTRVFPGNISLGLGSNPFGKRPQNLAKMAQPEINQLTSRHTQRNRKYNIDFEREVVHVDRNRASSPDAETQHRRAWEERLKRYEFQEETGIVLGPGDPIGWEPEVVTPTRKAVRWHADLEFGWNEDLEKNSPSTAKQVESKGLKGIIKKTLSLDGFGNALGLGHTPPEPPMTIRITKHLFNGEEDD